MPSTEYFYTKSFVNGKTIDIDKFKDESVSLRLNISGNKAEAQKTKRGSKGKISFINVKCDDKNLQNIISKLKEFDKRSGVFIKCKDDNELKDLLDGRIDTIYYGGGISETQVDEEVKLK